VPGKGKRFVKGDARINRAGDGRDATDAAGEKVVRGGSFFDPPKRCRSTFRLRYPPWQRVFNVGFRVACEADRPPRKMAAFGGNAP